MAGLSIGYQSPVGAPAAISPLSGPVGAVFSVNLPAGAACQWTLNGAPISGATSSTYTAGATGALGCQITLAGVTVTAAAVVLNTLTLSTTSFPAGVASPTVLATISGQTAGSTISISAADTSGFFAVNGAGTQLLAGLNYANMGSGATPTVALVETLAGASNSPKLSAISATVTGNTLVSASNRTNVQTANTSVNTTTKYFMNRTTHTTSVAVSGLQLTYANILVGASSETPGGNNLILRAPVILTNLQGSFGGSGFSANQIGATITKTTYAGVLNGQYIYTAPMGGTAWVPMTYAQFTAAGGSVTTDSYGYIITIPPGYIVQTDPGISLNAGQAYQLQTCQILAYNTVGMSCGPLNQAQRGWGGTNVTGDYYKAFGGNAVYPDTSASATTSAQMLSDPNWTSGGAYSLTFGGTTYACNPILISGINSGGIKSIVNEGCSIEAGTYEYGDNYGNSGAWARALFAKGYSFCNTAVAGMSLSNIRANQNYCVRLGLYRLLQPWMITTDHPRNDLGNWPTNGQFAPAAPDDETTATTSMALARWWNNKLRSVSPNSKINNVTLTTCVTSSTQCNVATISGATYSGTTIIYTVNSTANLTNGEVVQIRGMAPAVPYNALGPITLIDSTHFSMVGASAPTAAPTTATGTVDDGYQSYAGQSAPANSGGYATGVPIYHNDWVQCRNAYAGYTLTPSAGDPDSSWDQNTDYGIQNSPNLALWPPGSAFQSATGEGTHVGYGLATIGATALAPRLAGYIGH